MTTPSKENSSSFCVRCTLHFHVFVTNQPNMFSNILVQGNPEGKANENAFEVSSKKLLMQAKVGISSDCSSIVEFFFFFYFIYGWGQLVMVKTLSLQFPFS